MWKFCPYYTTLPQVVGYLKFRRRKTQKYHASQDVVVVKNLEKKYKETTPQLGVVGYNKDKIFVTFEGTPQLQVEWYQRNLKK